MSPLARYAGIWLAQIRYTVMRELMFKANFILWVIVDLAWFGLHLSFIQFLYLQVDTIAGWTKWGFILLVTTNMLVQQIFQMFLMTNLTKLPELIRTGKLDFFLAQPAPAQFLVSTRFFELGSVVNTLVALIVCAVALAHLDMPMSGAGLLVFPILVACGVLIHYAMLLMLMSLAFWMTRAQGFINAYYNVFQIARLPREAFHGPALFIFTWTIPLLLIANVPARTLLDGLNARDIAGMACATAILLGLSTLVFQAGLRRYGSASS
ncbi:MAG TPA: ABC-2 family transporter protein [Candidatus Methylacidiphilales bacterium]|nr:ABC-2 family transporter protein [Candidatus Methylacidiphilales bacterium]